MRVEIEYQDQFGHWSQYTSKQNEWDAYRVASNRAASTGKRHRLVSDEDQLIDLVEP